MVPHLSNVAPLHINHHSSATIDDAILLTPWSTLYVHSCLYYVHKTLDFSSIYLSPLYNIALQSLIYFVKLYFFDHFQEPSACILSSSFSLGFFHTLAILTRIMIKGEPHLILTSRPNTTILCRQSIPKIKIIWACGITRQTDTHSKKHINRPRAMNIIIIHTLCCQWHMHSPVVAVTSPYSQNCFNASQDPNVRSNKTNQWCQKDQECTLESLPWTSYNPQIEINDTQILSTYTFRELWRIFGRISR